jgi:hypothetical protein
MGLVTTNAVAIGFSDADAAAFIDYAAITIDFHPLPDDPPPGPFGPFVGFDVVDHFEQGAATTSWDGASTFDNDVDLNFSTTSFDGSVHALSHSDSASAPVFADTAADASNAGLSALTSVGFDTEASSQAFRDIAGTFDLDGSATITVPYEISYGSIPFLPDDVSIYTEVTSTITVWDKFNNPFYYFQSRYLWHTSILGAADSAVGDMILEPEFFDGEAFLLTQDVFTLIVIEDDNPIWGYTPLLENLINGTTLNDGEDGGGPTARSRPVPIPATIWLFGSGLIGLARIAMRKGKGRGI